MESNARAPDENEKKSLAPSDSSLSRQPEKRNRDKEKTADILDACKKKDLGRLRGLATSERGLISDPVRKWAWPLLLGEPSHDDVTVGEKGDVDTWKEMPKHRDEDQVQLDVDRSFIYYPNDQSPKDLEQRKTQLSDLITAVLRRQPYLCYFQGYHDICQVFLLVLDSDKRSTAVTRLSTLRIRDFMLPTLTPALAQLQLIPSILYAVNPKLCNHLPRTHPYYAISAALTMYAHDIREYGDIARLFDVFLAREAVFSVYMYAQIVLGRSDELFETPSDEPDILHSILSKLPKPLDIENLILNTVKLYEAHPPETLRPWSSISNFSVLKTAREPDRVVEQSLEDGEMYFNQQVKELKRAEQRDKILRILWKYRKPAGTVGLAVAIGILS
ncbi:rab-GTPase-TBC domain-containing protein, partial [Amylocarpus encephaloides]